MTTYFVDYVNGNDANDGLSFANRKQTVASLDGSLVASDEVRIMRSPAPTSLGQSVQWNNGTNLLTLSSAVTQTIDNCDANWTSSASVTTSLITSIRKQGTNSLRILFAGGFTTGKAAYRTLPGTLDLSTYQQVSCFLGSSLDFPAGRFELRLCSDSTGDVAVHTIPITSGENATFWPFTWDNGSALSSTVNSIALYVNSDPGTPSFWLDNIIACLAPSNAASLTHRSFVSKNTGSEAWYPIASIDGTAVALDRDPDWLHNATITEYYPGTTESVTTWKMEPIVYPTTYGTGGAVNNGDSIESLSDSGSSGSPITISGGWDETAMTTQEDYTWLQGQAVGELFRINGDWITMSQIASARFQYSWVVNTTGNDIVLDDCKAVGNKAGTTNFGPIYLLGINCTVQNCDIYANRTFGVYGIQSGTTISGCTAWANAFAGFFLTSTATPRPNNLVTNCTGYYNTTHGLACQEQHQLQVTGCTFTFNATSGISMQDQDTAEIINTECSNNGNYGFHSDEVTNNGDFVFRNFTADSNGLEAIRVPGANGVEIYGMTSDGHTETFRIDDLGWALVYDLVSTDTNIHDYLLSFNVNQNQRSRIRLHRFGGDANDNRVIGKGFCIRSDDGTGIEDNRRTASGLAWGIACNATRGVNFPAILRVATVKLTNGVTTTVTAWMKRTTANIEGRLVCKGRQIAGITSDVSDQITLTNTYEQMSLALTPTADGVVEIWAEAWDGTSFADEEDALNTGNDRVFIDDLAVS